MANPDPRLGVSVFYDGDCPVCHHYLTGLRLREAGGGLRLVNARDGGAEIEALQAAGHDLDREIVVRVGDREWTGGSALHVLGLLSTPSGFINRLMFRVFRSERLGSALYPAFRQGRLLLLRLLGRAPIGKAAS